MKVKILTTLVAAATVAISAPQVHANPILELISGASHTTVVGSAGSVMFVGSFGGWSINIDSGLAAPADGAAGNSLNLSCVDIAGAHAAALEIIFSAGTYSSPYGPASALATLDSANTATGATLTTYYGPTIGSMANALTTAITTGSKSGVLPTGGPYYLTEELVLGAGRSGAVDSADANLALTIPSIIRVPDGGMTAILLGGAMSVMALIRSRSRKS